MCSDLEVCGVISILLQGIFLQLLPVNGKPTDANVEDCDNLEKFFTLNMWHIFQ